MPRFWKAFLCACAPFAFAGFFAGLMWRPVPFSIVLMVGLFVGGFLGAYEEFKD